MLSIAILGTWPEGQRPTPSLHYIVGSTVRLLIPNTVRRTRANALLVDELSFNSLCDSAVPESRPCIVATQNPTNGAALLRAGADAVIALPVDIAELSSAALSLLKPSLHVSPRVIAALIHQTKAERGEFSATLSDRELDVLRELAAGRSDAEISAALFISLATVHTHILNLRRKLGARNRTHAVVIAIERGTIPPHAPPV